jgi:transcriptional regulator with PAS, ATPase and Fis domain
VREFKDVNVERPAPLCTLSTWIQLLIISPPTKLKISTPKLYVFDSRRTMKEAISDFERQYIGHVLRINQFNKELTAKILKISLSSLYRKIEELNIPLQG